MTLLQVSRYVIWNEIGDIMSGDYVQIRKDIVKAI
jgi:hypothetical protein